MKRCHIGCSTELRHICRYGADTLILYMHLCKVKMDAHYLWSVGWRCDKHLMMSLCLFLLIYFFNVCSIFLTTLRYKRLLWQVDLSWVWMGGYVPIVEIVCCVVNVCGECCEL